MRSVSSIRVGVQKTKSREYMAISGDMGSEGRPAKSRPGLRPNVSENKAYDETRHEQRGPRVTSEEHPGHPGYRAT